MTKFFLILALLFNSSVNAADVNWMCGQISAAAITPGSGYAASTVFQNRALTGGTGHDATVTLKTDANGEIISAVFGNLGQDYSKNDALTASLGPGSGFKLTITSVNNFFYTESQQQMKGRDIRKNVSPCRY